MPEPTAAEVVPKVIVREALPTRLVRPEDKMASQMIKRVDEGAWRKGAQEALTQQPIDKNKITQTLEQIGLERDPKTGAKKRSKAEDLRYNTAKDNSEVVTKFIEKRYEGMTTGEKTKLRNQVLTAARLNPATAPQLNRLTPDKQREWAEGKLKDPSYAVVVTNLLSGRSDPEAAENKITDEITPAQDALETAKLDHEDATTARKDHDRSLNFNSKRLDEYEERERDVGGVKTLVKGAKLRELEGIDANMQVAQRSVDSSRTNFLAMQDDVKRLQEELVAVTRLAGSGLTLPVGTRSRDTVSNELNQARVRESLAQEQLTRDTTKVDTLKATKERIDTEHAQLLDRQKQLDTEKRTLDKALKEKENKLKRSQQSLADAQRKRVGQEQGIVDGFGNVFSDATLELLNNQVTDALTAYNEELEVLKQKTTENNERAMYDALQKSMLGTEKSRKKGLIGFRKVEKYQPISRAKVNDYFTALMTVGPEAAMKELLLSTAIVNPATNAPYSDPEVTAILANKEYVAKMQPEVVKQIMARKMLIGGISQEDIHIIVNSQWGAGMIDKAKESNDAFRAAVEADMGPNAFSSPGFYEKLGDRIQKHPWWLYLILGIPFLAGGAMMGKSLENIGK